MFRSPKRKPVIENYLEEEQKPASNTKEKENNDEEMNENDLNEEQEYELEFDDEKYILKTGYSKVKDAIFLQIKPVDNKDIEDKNIIILYEGFFSSNDLTKLCKSFRMYDSIEEIFSAFCVIFENKKAYIKQNNENENDDSVLDLVIVVGSATGKEDEICLNLKKKEIKIIVEQKMGENHNNNNIFNNQIIQCNCALKEKEINSRIEKLEKDLKAENFELKNEVYFLKDDINRYKKTIDGNKKEIKNLKTQIKDLKTSFEETIKKLTDKINNCTNTLNTNNSTTNLNTNNDNNINSNNSNDNYVYESKKEPKTYDKNLYKREKANEMSTNAKRGLIQSNKKNNNTSSRLDINSGVKFSKNIDKKISSKREQYQQLKAASAKSHPNKEKTSFRDFLREKKQEVNNCKLNQSIEIKESIADNNKEKEDDKFLKKTRTNVNMKKTRDIKVCQSIDFNNNNKFELLKDDDDDEIINNVIKKKIYEKQLEKEKENKKDKDKEKENEKGKEKEKEKEKESEGENDEEEEEEEDDDEEENLNINEYLHTDTNFYGRNKKEKEKEKEKEKDKGAKDDSDILRLKTCDLNRGEKIDQWKFDFDLNVKKLLEDNASKLKFAEKLNKMNRKIINNVEELQLIENQLLKNYPDTKEIEYSLIYRASEDGDTSEIFHEKCDNISFTLTIIKNTDGNKFGGYTEEGWEGENVSKKDFNAFCFSLTKNKIYTVKPDKSAIICDPNLGPSFGSPLFHILDKFFTDGGTCYPKDGCGYNGQDSDFEICNGKEDFDIQELEIYKVNFN